MGTRALFFVGNPMNRNDDGVVQAEWLGAVAWDGYPGGFEWPEIKTEEQYREWVSSNIENRKDFASPKGGFPFPWADTIFLTDFTYAFYDGAVRIVDCGGATVGEVMKEDFDPDEHYVEGLHSLKASIAGKDTWDTSQPDSIIVVRA